MDSDFADVAHPVKEPFEQPRSAEDFPVSPDDEPLGGGHFPCSSTPPPS